MGIFRDMWLVSSALAWFSDERGTRRRKEPEIYRPPPSAPFPPIPPEILTPETFQRWPELPEPEPAAEDELDEYYEPPKPPRPGVPMREFATGRTWYECYRRDEVSKTRCWIRAVGFTRKRDGDLHSLLPMKVRGQLWLLRVEAMNRMSQPLKPWDIPSLLELVHPDGRAFRPVRGRYDADDPSGVRDFSTASELPALQKGATARGGIVFILPDEAVEYTISVEGGTIRAVEQ